MKIYDEEWAENYERLAEAGIPGREGLYRLCKTIFSRSKIQGKALVVGCGTGADLIPLAEDFTEWQFDALEPADAMRTYCQSQIDKKKLSGRINLHACDLEAFDGNETYDIVTSILVSQHIENSAEAQRFFSKLYSLIKPGGWLYTADIHFPLNQPESEILDLWSYQAKYAGTPEEIVENLLVRFSTDLKPRQEEKIVQLLNTAGLKSPVKVFSSLIYGAWCAQRGA